MDGIIFNFVNLNLNFWSEIWSIGKLFISEKSNLHSFVEDKNSNGEMMDIPTTTIPDFCKGKREIDFIRMDIEGYEVEVLEGLLPGLEDDDFREGNV